MAKALTNEQVLTQFRYATAVLEVRHANIFRIRAYQAAMDSIKGLDEELASIVKRGALGNIAGIGTDLEEKITDLVTKGKTPEWEKLFQSVPAGMFALLDIPGIGPKRAHQLAKAFGLADRDTAIEILKNAAQEGKVSRIEGFGEKN